MSTQVKRMRRRIHILWTISQVRQKQALKTFSRKMKETTQDLFNSALGAISVNHSSVEQRFLLLTHQTSPQYSVHLYLFMFVCLFTPTVKRKDENEVQCILERDWSSLKVPEAHWGLCKACSHEVKLNGTVKNKEKRNKYTVMCMFERKLDEDYMKDFESQKCLRTFQEEIL